MDGALVEWYWQRYNELNTWGKISLIASFSSTEHIWTGPGSKTGMSVETPATNLPSHDPIIHVERMFVCLCSKRTAISEKTFESFIQIYSCHYCSLKKVRILVTLYTKLGILKVQYLWQLSLMQKHQNTGPQFQYKPRQYFSASSPYACLDPTIIFSWLLILFQKCTP
jgi:hypothetical protein